MDDNCSLCGDPIPTDKEAYEEATVWLLKDEPVTLPILSSDERQLVPVTRSVSRPTGRRMHRTCVEDVTDEVIVTTEMPGQEKLFP